MPSVHFGEAAPQAVDPLSVLIAVGTVAGVVVVGLTLLYLIARDRSSLKVTIACGAMPPYCDAVDVTIRKVGMTPVQIRSVGLMWSGERRYRLLGRFIPQDVDTIGFAVVPPNGYPLMNFAGQTEVLRLRFDDYASQLSSRGLPDAVYVQTPGRRRGGLDYKVPLTPLIVQSLTEFIRRMRSTRTA